MELALFSRHQHEKALALTIESKQITQNLYNLFSCAEILVLEYSSVLVNRNCAPSGATGPVDVRVGVFGTIELNDKVHSRKVC